MKLDDLSRCHLQLRFLKPGWFVRPGAWVEQQEIGGADGVKGPLLSQYWLTSGQVDCRPREEATPHSPARQNRIAYRQAIERSLAPAFADFRFGSHAEIQTEADAKTLSFTKRPAVWTFRPRDLPHKTRGACAHGNELFRRCRMEGHGRVKIGLFGTHFYGNC
jgi:hypothetical protein